MRIIAMECMVVCSDINANDCNVVRVMLKKEEDIEASLKNIKINRKLKSVKNTCIFTV